MCMRMRWLNLFQSDTFRGAKFAIGILLPTWKLNRRNVAGQNTAWPTALAVAPILISIKKIDVFHTGFSFFPCDFSQTDSNRSNQAERVDMEREPGLLEAQLKAVLYLASPLRAWEGLTTPLIAQSGQEPVPVQACQPAKAAFVSTTGRNSCFISMVKNLAICHINNSYKTYW